MKRYFISIALVVLVSFNLTSAAGRPNIIIIMSDDMGMSDIGCYGGEIPTPNLDKLGYGGIRFTQFYNSTRCCPTRVSLLMGLHPHQAGMGWMVHDRNLPGYRGDMGTNGVTIAEVLREVGYRSYCVGKWHVTSAWKSTDSQHNWPLQRGFDRYYGLVHGAVNFFDPELMVRDNTPVTAASDVEYQPETYYLTDAISDYAVRYIKEHNAETPDKPFFMYIAYTAPHWPMQAPEETIAKFRGWYDEGYQPIREARFKRMKEKGIIPEHAVLPPPDEDWARVVHKEWESRCMEVYAAMIDHMDQGIGRIIDALKATGQYENTVIFFLHDNGPSAEGVGRTSREDFPTRVDQPVYPVISPETIIDVGTSAVTQTRDGFPIVRGPLVMPGPGDTFIAYGRGWANVSSTPFRGYKMATYEGGIGTPLIVHAPNWITEAMRGKVCHAPGHLVDLMTTCVELAGATYPTEFRGNEILPMEGISLVPRFRGLPLAKREHPLAWEHQGNRALRDGKWKIVTRGPRGDWELYDMENDRSEMHNLANRYPERVQEMAKQWEEWAKRTNALPWPWQ